MADNKKKRGKADRARVSGSDASEVRYFAKKNRMTPAAVRKLIKKVGNSRKKLEAAVKRMRAKKRGKKKTSRRKKRR
jgi:hypothetical protein